MAHALADITVLDLSHALAGPFTSTMLGDYGADVIKIEPPEGGDMARRWGPPFYGGESAYFVNLNRNKRSLALDLKQPAGRDLFFQLLDRADVVIENLRVGTVEKLGVDYARCRARNPRIIYASISGFGQDGPYRDRAALDLVVQAESGMISVTGPAEGSGVRCGISIADITAGMFAAFSVMTALHARQASGVGQYIDVSMLEGQMSILGGVIGTYIADGEIPGPMGTAYKALLPYQTFHTKTRDIAIGVGSDRLWQVFCPAIGLAHFADDARFATNAARSANRRALVDALQAAFLTKAYRGLGADSDRSGRAGWRHQYDRRPRSTSAGARPWCACQTKHPTAGRLRVVGPPTRLSETPGVLRRAAPLLGEHTREILRDIGIDAAELARHEASGVIACAG